MTTQPVKKQHIITVKTSINSSEYYEEVAKKLNVDVEVVRMVCEFQLSEIKLLLKIKFKERIHLRGFGNFKFNANKEKNYLAARERYDIKHKLNK